MADNNKYTAETPIDLAGKSYTLLFTWRQHGEIRTVFGHKSTQQILTDCHPEEIATLLEIGFKAKNPEITRDFILDLNPPPDLADVMMALSTALIRSINGGKPDEDDSQVSPPQRGQSATT